VNEDEDGSEGDESELDQFDSSIDGQSCSSEECEDAPDQIEEIEISGQINSENSPLVKKKVLEEAEAIKTQMRSTFSISKVNNPYKNSESVDHSSR
jgi:hypothetical protein